MSNRAQRLSAVALLAVLMTTLAGLATMTARRKLIAGSSASGKVTPCPH